MLSAQTLSVSINKPFDEVYQFASQPQNFALWAEGLGSDLRVGMGGIWLAETPAGPAEIQFTPRNDYGVLDHTVRLPAVRIHVPLRVVRNGEGCEVMLTVFRLEHMSDAEFNSDLTAVTRDSGQAEEPARRRRRIRRARGFQLEEKVTTRRYGCGPS
jgi:hypothetical protein